MLHIDLTLEDSRLIATRSTEKWMVTLLDNLSGKSVDLQWTDEQIAAVVALGLGGDNLFNGEEFQGMEVVSALYSVAEPCFKDVPTECRLIP